MVKHFSPQGKIACLQLHDYVLTVEAKYLQVQTSLLFLL